MSLRKLETIPLYIKLTVNPSYYKDILYNYFPIQEFLKELEKYIHIYEFERTQYLKKRAFLFGNIFEKVIKDILAGKNLKEEYKKIESIDRLGKLKKSKIQDDFLAEYIHLLVYRYSFFGNSEPPKEEIKKASYLLSDYIRNSNLEDIKRGIVSFNDGHLEIILRDKRFWLPRKISIRTEKTPYILKPLQQLWKPIGILLDGIIFYENEASILEVKFSTKTRKSSLKTNLLQALFQCIVGASILRKEGYLKKISITLLTSFTKPAAVKLDLNISKNTAERFFNEIIYILLAEEKERLERYKKITKHLNT